MHNLIHNIYKKIIRPHLSSMQQQRFKLIWTVWGYSPIFTIYKLSFRQQVQLLSRLIRIDWNVPHGHWPGEITRVIMGIAERFAEPGEVVVEAGSWQGGSTAKLSIISNMLGYRLFVFDSFQGVEFIENNPFSGTYSATLRIVKNHVNEYGNIEQCEFIPGWFSDTLAANPLREKIRVVFIDCDLAKGTREVLTGVINSLVSDGIIFSQDYHISEVRQLLNDMSCWKSIMGNGQPIMDERLTYRQLVAYRIQ